MRTQKEHKCPICKEPLITQFDSTGNPGIDAVLERLSMVTVHDDCYDKVQSEGRRAVVETEVQGRKSQWYDICPIEFRKVIDWSNPRAKRHNYDAVYGWTPTHKGFIVTGATGLCKTRFVMKMLARHFVDGTSVVMVTHADFRHSVGNLMMTDTAKFRQMMDGMMKSDVLFMDDLGNGKFTPAVEEAFEAILNERTRQNRPCLFTCNVGMDALAATLSDERRAPIIRRIVEFCDEIKFTK